MSTTVVNLTPHVVTVFDEDGENIIRSYPPSGNVMRLSTVQRVWGEIDGIPAITQSFGELTGFPDGEIESGIVYIVPLLTLSVLAEMGDDNYYVAPDTGPTSVVRDEKGSILGVRRFVVAA